MQFIELFPTVIGRISIDRKFTDEEVKTFESFTMVENYYNITTKNNYVLDHENLLPLKKELVEKCNQYIKTVYDPIESSNINLYITQSWINITEKNQSHHPHKHPNSFISGVLYLMGDDETICFSKSDYRMIEIVPQNWSRYNSSQWNLKVKKGDIVIFPSSLEHSVPKNENDYVRASLSFNTFITGVFGLEEELTHLKLV